MIIPWQDLDPETLDNLIETFVLREGTDYGEHERSLADKVADVKQQLKSGEAVLVWSELHETVNIMPASSSTAKAAPHHRLIWELICLPNIR
nr:Uncharacterised protein family (UPF0270) [Raoultella sp. NCTC 9187]